MADNEYTTITGVTLTVRPFGLRMYQKFAQQALEKYPQPKDKKKRKQVEDERNQWLGEKLLGWLLDFCVELDMEAWEPTIRRLEKHTGPYPEDPDERRLEFLTTYALARGSEYTDLLTMALKLGG